MTQKAAIVAAAMQLEALRHTDPEGYQQVLLPHFFNYILVSPLVPDYNQLIAAIGEPAPEGLTPEKLDEYTMGNRRRILSLIKSIGTWLNGQSHLAQLITGRGLDGLPLQSRESARWFN